MSHADKKLLIVDDEDLLLEMLVTVFEDENYQVDSASNGVEAYKLLQANHYDLLLTDVFMPEMNGIELMENCRQLSPATKIILLSGGGKTIQAKHGSQRVQYEDKVYPVDLFMKKPWSLTELLNKVETLLN